MYGSEMMHAFRPKGSDYGLVETQCISFFFFFAFCILHFVLSMAIYSWPEREGKHKDKARLTYPFLSKQYLLVRPYPSLRITFTSPALRIPGLLQTKFLDRIGGPEQVREGLLDSFAHGTGVTAKVTWISSSNSGFEGKPRWIHCTPLMGSDEKVGVWMVVMVDNEEITGGLRRSVDVSAMAGAGGAGGAGGSSSGSVRQGAASPRYSGGAGAGGNKLYAEYLRREGRPGTAGTNESSESAREKKDVDHQFRDF